MNSAPIIAAANTSGWNVPSVAASAVPTSTGATAAGSVRVRGGVEEEVGGVGELLDAAEAVLRGVEARLHQPQRERREHEHLAAPGDGLRLEALERHDRVHEAHL